MTLTEAYVVRGPDGRYYSGIDFTDGQRGTPQWTTDVRHAQLFPYQMTRLAAGEVSVAVVTLIKTS
jgi:hypothetical protein